MYAFHVFNLYNFQLMLIHEIHVFELRIELNFMCMNSSQLFALLAVSSSKKGLKKFWHELDCDDHILKMPCFCANFSSGFIKSIIKGSRSHY